MGKKKQKTKKKCCGKYLKTGKHCRDCPLLKEGGGAKEKKEKKKDKEKKGKKK